MTTLKSTPLVSAIGLQDLIRVAGDAGQNTKEYFQFYMVTLSDLSRHRRGGAAAADPLGDTGFIAICGAGGDAHADGPRNACRIFAGAAGRCA